MIHRATLHGTPVQVSRLSFGTSHLHHMATSFRRQGLLAKAFEVGITHFDTSPYYGYGLAETELGEFLRRERRSAITIATKIGLYPAGGSGRFVGSWGVWSRILAGKAFPKLSRPIVDWSTKSADASLNLSLQRLGVERVDILLLHEPHHDLLSADEFVEWLTKQRRLGKLRVWGLAGHFKPMRQWVEGKHPITSVLQVKDSLENKEADGVLACGRELQFTYGYFHAHRAERPGVQNDDILSAALQRNRTGSVLFSTRDPKRLTAIAALAEASC